MQQRTSILRIVLISTTVLFISCSGHETEATSSSDNTTTNFTVDTTTSESLKYPELEPHQQTWPDYVPPEDYTALRLNSDSIHPRAVFHNVPEVLGKIPDLDKLLSGVYYPIPPAMNDAIFQNEDFATDVYEDMVLDESYLYSWEKWDYFADGVFAITVFKRTAVYLCTQYFLTYNAAGKLIDYFDIAEYNGDGGYYHETHGWFENDSTFVVAGEGSEVTENGNEEFLMDTLRYLICWDGGIEEVE